jgi:Fanconi anemia group M protein
MTGLLIVDRHEPESRLVPTLHRLGVVTEVRRLPVGDYAVGSSLVERKTVNDLHRSIIEGRFWLQIGRLRRASVRPYLLVEGSDLDAGPLRTTSIRGALLAVDELGVGVVRSSDGEDSALWLKVLADRQERRRRLRSTYRQQRGEASTPEAMLAAVPGISRTSARALLNRFGSIEAILSAGREQWLSVEGIGQARAAALQDAFQSRRCSPSGTRSVPQALPGAPPEH